MMTKKSFARGKAPLWLQSYKKNLTFPFALLWPLRNFADK